MDKFSDNLGSIPVGSYVPTTVAALFDKLHVEDESPDKQERAIRQWLAENEPTEMMLFSIRRNGFGHLLAWGSGG